MVKQIQPRRPAASEKRISNPVRAALIYALWHHQGASSTVGQPIRAMLGMGEHQRLSEAQLTIARTVQSTLEKVSDGAEPVAWMLTGAHGHTRCVWVEAPRAEMLEMAKIDGDTVTPLYSSPVAAKSKNQRLKFPTALRKMWSGAEVQAWLDSQQDAHTPEKLLGNNPSEVLKDEVDDKLHSKLDAVTTWSAADWAEVLSYANEETLAKLPNFLACPFPCGWQTLHKIAVQDAAFLAKFNWPEDEEGVSVPKAVAMRSMDNLIRICRAMLSQSASQKEAPASVAGGLAEAIAGVVMQVYRRTPVGEAMDYSDIHEAVGSVLDVHDESRSALTQQDADKVDAERYRLVSTAGLVLGGGAKFGWSIAPVFKEEWDKYIDSTFRKESQ